ncbi:hypothetical protein [Pelobacter seleniigenes]|uniref:hypothetical protein n=1 Tax=Pelobacter seleniigenes TaxID=407188 RepID=UPI0004A74F2B|nr:hypothetical protein [Pelobacter seleniigenes]
MFSPDRNASPPAAEKFNQRQAISSALNRASERAEETERNQHLQNQDRGMPSTALNRGGHSFLRSKYYFSIGCKNALT